MTQRLEIHPTHPQVRRVRVAAECLRAGGVIVYPTDTAYALACHIGDKAALERITRIKRLPRNHQFTLAVRDLSELGTYARVDNVGFRLLRRVTPGPFTFVMRATRETPKRLLHPKRKTIGVRVIDHPAADMLLQELGEPVLTTTVRLAGEAAPLLHADAIFERIGNQIDVLLDDGSRSDEVSTVVDLTHDEPEILRQGLGVL